MTQPRDPAAETVGGGARRGARLWTVHIYGFEPHDVAARSSGAARYADYQTLRDAGYSWDFHKFLISSRVTPARLDRRSALAGSTAESGS